ncbi:hypothetical protein [Clostridium sp. E02]|nr:hypothetical protein [Clostridium sp. E02]
MIIEVFSSVGALDYFTESSLYFAAGPMRLPGHCWCIPEPFLIIQVIQ